MRKPDHSAEPSIEEILASIRSIIADDGRQTARPPVARGPDAGPGVIGQDHEDAFRDESGRLNVYTHTPEAHTAAEASGAPADEILELTEDFMVAEQDPPRKTVRPHGSGATGVPPQEDDAGFPGLAGGEDLDAILSNLAAEVDRLSAPEERYSPAVAHDAGTGDGSEPDDDDASATLPVGADALRDMAEHAPLGQPPVEGLAEPQATQPAPPVTSHPPASAPASRGAAKPVWSARRLESGGAAKPEAKAPSPSPKQAEMSGARMDEDPPAAHVGHEDQTVSAARDLWAEGFQMPVPETGPEMPLPHAGRGTAADASAPEEQASPAGGERQAVGRFLSRVFGAAPPPPQDDAGGNPDAEKDALRARAERLARETISDFAEDKLNAPAVGSALTADRDFMDQVASSLESALSESAQSAEPGQQEQSAVPPSPHAEAGYAEAPETAADDEPAGLPPPDVEAVAGASAAQPAPPASSPSGPDPQETPDAPPPLISADGLPSNLESSIKEMIKPLIIEWLNDNLPRIVEQAVREELAGRAPLTGAKVKSSA